MLEVGVVSKSMVQARKNEEQRIELSPCDLFCLGLNGMHRVLVYPKPELQAVTTLVEHLKTSLSYTLDFFYPLAGRLAVIEYKEDDTDTDTYKKASTSFSIDCNNKGAQFVYAVVADQSVTVADIAESDALHPFFPFDGIKNLQGISNPLLGIQVTELVDGIIVGCTMNHAVADGTSLWNFLNSWSEICRGFVHISNPPVFDRSFFFGGGGGSSSGGYFPIRFPFSVQEIKDQIAFTSFLPGPAGETRFFHFSKNKIAELKAKANNEAKAKAEAVGDINVISNISSFQSVLAQTWRFALKIQGVNPDSEEETSFSFVVGIRSRMEPPLPEHYFGNGIHVDFGKVCLKVKEILREDYGLGYAALQINKAVAAFTPDKVRTRLENWVQNPELVNFGSHTKSFYLVGSPRFNIYGVDFGWGKPISVRARPFYKSDRVMRLSRGVEEGSMDLEIRLSPESLETMANSSQLCHHLI